MLVPWYQTPCGPLSIHSPPFHCSYAFAFTPLRILPSPKIHLEAPLHPSTLRLCCVSKVAVRPQDPFLLHISSTKEVHTPHHSTFHTVWHHLCGSSHQTAFSQFVDHITPVYQDVALSTRSGLCIVAVFQCLEQCLAHSRYSINIC